MDENKRKKKDGTGKGHWSTASLGRVLSCAKSLGGKPFLTISTSLASGSLFTPHYPPIYAISSYTIHPSLQYGWVVRSPRVFESECGLSHH
jgi:hypothetical protein